MSGMAERSARADGWRAGAGRDEGKGWDFCVRSNRKNRDSAEGRGEIAGRRT